MFKLNKLKAEHTTRHECTIINFRDKVDVYNPINLTLCRVNSNVHNPNNPNETSTSFSSQVLKFQVCCTRFYYAPP
jgi:hypothetical protein